jgi:ferrochelatase
MDETTGTSGRYDAVLLVSFGGPESPDEVLPFLERVTAGRAVPRARLSEVAGHYLHFGGRSPINDQCRALIDVLSPALASRGIDLPLYWGNRNWHPLLDDTVAAMARDGVHRAIAIATSAFSSYSGCRQYLEDIERAREGLGYDAPRIDKIPPFFDFAGFIEAVADRARRAIASLARGGTDAELVFTAHSIPTAMAARCDYVMQLQAASAAVADQLGRTWSLAFQSRSGPPSVPWLGPDILDQLRALAANGHQAVVLVPIGFVSDHMEVCFDLDVEAAPLALELGMAVARAGTVGTHPSFVGLLADLVAARVAGVPGPIPLGLATALPPQCDTGCCLGGVRSPA